jgi:hypothetical protein
MESGKWLYRGQEITQENVLSFFKKSIREDNDGIYITNTYAELTEHGYIEAKTIFLKIISSIEKDNIIYLLGEDDSSTPIKDFYFYSDSEEKIFCMRKSDTYIKFYFNRQMHSFISSLLVEENGYYFLQLSVERIPINPFPGKIEVVVPASYAQI